MADGIFDFFSREAGQARRRRLGELGAGAMYYVPPELRGLIEMLGEANPVSGVGRAGQAAQELVAPGVAPLDRVGAGGRMLSEMAGVAAPAMVASRAAMPAAQAIQEGLLGFSAGAQDVGRAVVDRLNQPGPMPTVYSNPIMRGMGDNGGTAMQDVIGSVDLPPGSRPEYLGAAPVRAEPYQRYRPAKTTARMSRLQEKVFDPENPIRGVFDRYIEKGKTLGGPDWYNTEELRDWFISQLGEAEGDRQWREFGELIGTTSTGAKVPANIRMASFYRALAPEDRLAVAQIVKDEGITPKEAAARLGVVPENTPENYAYGHIKQRNQAGNVINREAGQWSRAVPEDLTGAALSKYLQANPKVKGFGNDLLGSDVNIAADMHFMRMLGMADGGGDFLNQQAKLSKADYDAAAKIIGPKNIKNYTSTRMVNGKPVSEVNLYKAWQDGKIKDTSAFQSIPTAWADTPKANEYAAYEDMAGRVAREYGMTPAQFQASLWMGAGDLTGLADESQGTFMDLFRRSLDSRAQERGISRREMLLDFINNRAPLMFAPAVPAAGLLAYPDEEQY